MKTRLVASAAVVAQAVILLAVAPLVAPPQAGAAAIVDVTVVVEDVNGRPISGVPWRTESTADGSTLVDRFKSDRRGRGTFHAYQDATAQLEMVTRHDGSVSAPWHVRHTGGRLVDNTGPTTLAYDITGEQPTITVTLPVLRTKTLRVLTRGDRRPVANVGISSESSVSRMLPGREMRISFDGSMSTGTGYSGRARMTTFSMEPDESVAVQFAFFPDHDFDGDYEYAYYNWTPRYAGSSHGRGIDYAVWASQNVTRVTVGFSPMVDRARSEVGRTRGTAHVSARVVQWWGVGEQRDPLAGVTAYLVRPGSSTEDALATDRSDDRGRVEFRGLRLSKRTPVIVVIDGTHVPDRVVAHPRR